MLTVTIIAIGKIKEKYLTDACMEYQKRLSAFCKCSVEELREYRLPDNPSSAQISAGIVEEGKLISSKIPPNSFVFAMCIEGAQQSSNELAATINAVTIAGKSSVVFLIGGSNGLWNELKTRADVRLSMSAMTFPHQLARVMLLEQIYRAHTIIANHKYHK